MTFYSSIFLQWTMAVENKSQTFYARMKELQAYHQIWSRSKIRLTKIC